MTIDKRERWVVGVVGEIGFVCIVGFGKDKKWKGRQVLTQYRCKVGVSTRIGRSEIDNGMSRRALDLI